jgi:integrase
MAEIDLYNSIKGYHNRLKALKEDTRISQNNKKHILKYLEFKKNELCEGLTKTEIESKKIAHSKTLAKYIQMLSSIALWFPNFDTITEQELADIKTKLYNQELISYAGKTVTKPNDLVTKVIKSSFFKKQLGLAQEVENVFYSKQKRKQPEPDWITIEQLRELTSTIQDIQGKLAVTLMFHTGLRIGELLQLKKEDIIQDYNEDTKIRHYSINIRPEIAKGNKSRLVPIIDSDTNDFLEQYLQIVPNKRNLITKGYGAIYKQLETAATTSRVKTIPLNKKVTPHTLRRSYVCHYQNKGMSTDDLKAVLGHSPTSDVLNHYQNYNARRFDTQLKASEQTSLKKIRSENEDLRNQLIAMQFHHNQYDKKLEAQTKVIGDLQKSISNLIRKSKSKIEYNPETNLIS